MERDDLLHDMLQDTGVEFPSGNLHPRRTARNLHHLHFSSSSSALVLVPFGDLIPYPSSSNQAGVHSPSGSRHPRPIRRNRRHARNKVEPSSSHRPLASIDFLSRWSIGALLGRVGFGNVYAVTQKSSGREFAVKVENKSRDNLRAEYDIYRKLARRADSEKQDIPRVHYLGAYND